MKFALRLLAAAVLALALVPGTASAGHLPDQSKKTDEIFTSPNQATNSDLAFWGDHAFVGYYTGGAGFPPGTGPAVGCGSSTSPIRPRRGW